MHRPAQHRFHRRASQHLEQGVQLPGVRRRGGISDRLQQLTEHVRRSQPFRHSEQRIPLPLIQIHRTLAGETRFLNEECNGLVVAGRQEVEHQVAENINQFAAHLLRRLALEEVEQHAEHVARQILLIFGMQSLANELELVLIQKVDGGIELRHADDSGGRGFLLRRCSGGLHVHLALHAVRRTRFELDNALRHELDELIAKVDEVLLPEQRHQIVLVRRGPLDALEQPEQAVQLIHFESAHERQFAKSVLIQHPGQALGLRGLAGDHFSFPLELGFRDCERELIGLGP